MDSIANFCEMVAHAISFVNNINTGVRELHPSHMYWDSINKYYQNVKVCKTTLTHIPLNHCFLF